jgi:shikimate dehydrogenase
MSATYGILGWPVEHSRSPAMQNAAFKARGLDANYVRFPVHPDDVAEAIRGLRALGIRGANVTVPHKEAVIDLLDEVTAEARAIGAVNTIVRDGERLIGHNTDAQGLTRSLEEAGVTVVGANVTVLGAGGAARAAVAGLARRGAARICVAARRLEQAGQLVEALSELCSPCALVPCDLSPVTLDEAFADTHLLVQSTSATLGDSPAAAAFLEQLPMERLLSSASVVDLVYKPRETAVLVRAKQLGLRTVDGLGMLLHQGALAFELWTHLAAPVPVMRAALEEA